jgi:hypothetical protein
MTALHHAAAGGLYDVAMLLLDKVLLSSGLHGAVWGCFCHVLYHCNADLVGLCTMELL